MWRAMKTCLPVVVAVIAVLAPGCNSSKSGTSSSGSTGSAPVASGGGGGGPGGAVGSCTIQAGKTCFDYVGPAFTSESVQTACSRIRGVYSATTCVTANRVGSCAMTVGTPTAQTVRYY